MERENKAMTNLNQVLGNEKDKPDTAKTLPPQVVMSESEERGG